MVDKNLEDRINKNIEIPFRMTMVFEKIFQNIPKYKMEYILYYKLAQNIILYYDVVSYNHDHRHNSFNVCFPCLQYKMGSDIV